VIQPLAPACGAGALGVIYPRGAGILQRDAVPVNAFDDDGNVDAVQQRGIIWPIAQTQRYRFKPFMEAILFHQPVNRHVFAAPRVQHVPEACALHNL